MHAVRFYFDFVSPYSWLAMAQAEAFAREHGVAWQLRPFLFGALLDRMGTLATGEDPRRRAHGHRDIQRVAHRLGLAFRGPPEHPYLSLAALRLQLAGQRAAPERGLALARALFAACWEQGLDLNDPATLQQAAGEAGLPQEVLGATRSAEVKQQLRAYGDAAWEDGVFGLPSFVTSDGELFYGQDRLAHLADHLAGKGPADYLPDDRPGRQRPAAER